LERDFNAYEWGKLTLKERVVLCRQFAVEALQLSSAAGDQFKPLYVDLANQWTRLADAFEGTLSNT